MDNLPEYTSIDVYVTLGRYRPLSVASALESCSETSALEAGRQYQPYTLKVIRYAYSMSGNPGTWEFEDEGFVVDSDLGV